MKAQRTAKALGAAALCLSALAGCMTADEDGTNIIGTDPFPKPMGETLIPLTKDVYATYRYAEFDGTGATLLTLELPLTVKAKGGGLYGYAFERDDRGILIAFLDKGGNRDSAGIYLMGTFRDSFLTLDSAPALWLPQFPKPGISWDMGGGRLNALVDADTSFWTETLFPRDDSTTIRHGFQKQPTFLFREAKGDTVTHYHFRRGVGCVGFQRAVAGKLMASGSLFRFNGSPGYVSLR